MAGPEERETTITFTDADDDMQIVTANRKLKGRLKKLGFEPEESEDGHDFYEVPREFLQLRKPREAGLTDEEKEERRERLREVRKAAGIGEFAPGRKKSSKSAKKARKPEPVDEADDDDDDDEEVDPTSMSIGQLRAYAKSQGVSGTGTKKDILARLNGEDDEEDEPEDDDEDFDDEEEETEVVRPKARKSSSAARGKKGPRKR